MHQLATSARARPWPRRAAVPHAQHHRHPALAGRPEGVLPPGHQSTGLSACRCLLARRSSRRTASWAVRRGRTVGTGELPDPRACFGPGRPDRADRLRPCGGEGVDEPGDGVGRRRGAGRIAAVDAQGLDISLIGLASPGIRTLVADDALRFGWGLSRALLHRFIRLPIGWLSRPRRSSRAVAGTRVHRRVGRRRRGVRRGVIPADGEVLELLEWGRGLLHDIAGLATPMVFGAQRRLMGRSAL